ncbi:B12-binding domain-containing radical SAM protein [Methanotorris formicicus]|uniref:Radical SAM domain protein n=1 Tax=Methanotorris formicicus Mc-S-70 TaxID=647171 RepID=H1KXE8_9EURY|nr:radical SAM protein [Methanotorris formicicus]EHP88360.1 Radical SAM domain protein [Methanotorris formicicus Mc-S-70]
MKALIIDCLATVDGKKLLTRDVIGCGPRTVKGILKNEGIDAKIAPLEYFKVEDIKNYDLLFISGMTVDFKGIKNLVDKINRKRNEDQKIIIGGPIANNLYILEEIEGDISIVGEGEITIRELIKKDFNAENVEGTTYYDYYKEELIINPLRGIIKDMKLITPSTEIEDYPNYFSGRVYVEVVRGCSNFKRALLLCDNKKCNLCENGTTRCPLNINPGCGFCSVPSVFGYARSRDLEDILFEIEDLFKRGVKRVVLSAPDFLDYKRGNMLIRENAEQSEASYHFDETFLKFRGDDILINPKEPHPNYEAIEELLSNLYDLKIKYNASVSLENVKANLFDEKVAKIISKYLPNTPLYIGCETGDEVHSKLLGRPSLPEDVLKAVKIARKYSLRPQVYFIYGLPGQNMETAMNTINFMDKIKNHIDKITVYKFKPLPMSAFENFNPIMDKSSMLIKEKAREINKYVKKKYLSKKVDVIVSERHFKNKKDAVGYMVNGGPMVVVKNGANFIGKTVKVKITKTYEKFVEGIVYSK